MQISVLKPDKDNIQRIQGVIDYVYRAYKISEVEAYIIKEDGEIGFVFYGTNVNGEEMNLYINNKESGLEFTAFTLDENGNFEYIGNEEYRYFIGEDGITVIDNKTGIQYLISVVPLVSSSADKVSFNSYLSFRQYNPESDVACELQYAQSLNLDKKDTNIYVKNPENIFIDSEWSKKGSLKPGFVPSSRKYFSKISVQEYDISDMSVVDSVRYVPIKYVTKMGDYLTLGYFSKKYEFEEVEDMIKSQGFMSCIPNKFVDIYKECDLDLRKLSWIVSEVEEERQKEENDKGMVFQLVFEEQ